MISLSRVTCLIWTHLSTLRHGGDGRPGSGGKCDGKGTMSYGEETPNRWSECSRRDFRAHYNQVLDKANGQWCLPAAESRFNCANRNCGGNILIAIYVYINERFTKMDKLIN